MTSLSLSLSRGICNTSNLRALAVVSRYSFRANSSSAPSPTTTNNLFRQTQRKNSSATADAAEANGCPHFTFNSTESTSVIHHTAEWQNALPYHEIPGPKPIPILGNTWRYVFMITSFFVFV